jgi:hypothetical protein
VWAAYNSDLKYLEKLDRIKAVPELQHPQKRSLSRSLMMRVSGNLQNGWIGPREEFLNFLRLSPFEFLVYDPGRRVPGTGEGGPNQDKVWMKVAR